MGYRDEWQGWIWDIEMNDKYGYGIKRWMTRINMGYRDVTKIFNKTIVPFNLIYRFGFDIRCVKRVQSSLKLFVNL